MAKVLILFAHPALEKSRIHSSLIRHVKHLQGVNIHDLYEAYPDFDIDVKREQHLLMMHDVIIWQHPFYWYSSPALIKQWLDLVLEHGWAYGGETKLQGKKILNAISCGGPKEAYSLTGRNRYSIKEFLYPFSQTAALCKMEYLPPFVIHGTHRLKPYDIELYAIQYEQVINALTSDMLTEDEWNKSDYLNELIPITEPFKTR